jgi:serine/alanine adding enzyme
MKIIINSSIDITSWNNLLQKSKFTSPFQTPEYYKIINLVDGINANVFAIEDKDDYKALIVITILKEKGIKSLFSIRAIVYGGPILLENDATYLHELLVYVNNYYKRKVIYLETRNSFNYNYYNDVYVKNNWIYNDHNNVQLNVIGLTYDEVLSSMKYNRKREIRISSEHGARVDHAKNESEVEQLYYILKNIYTERVKLPLPTLQYFLTLYKSNIGKVFIVTHKDRIIGGAFCLFTKNAAIFTLYYAGLRAYHKKIFPTHLAISGVIDYAINNGLKMIDFMGAGKPDQSYGVRDYKLQFGGELVEHGRYQHILHPLKYRLGVLGLKVLAKFN